VPDSPDIPIENVAAPERQRFGQFVAVAIVVTTLLAALCGYLQAHALTHNDDALVRGEQWSEFASRITDQDQQAQQLLVARARRARSERLQAAYDSGQARWNAQPTAGASAQQLQALAATTNADSRQLCQGLSAEFASIRAADSAWLSDPVDAGGGNGRSCSSAASDTSTAGGSASFVSNDQRILYQLDGLKEASNTEAAAAEKQFTRYAVSLAILAVAVFLLGYSLTPHGRHHRKLYAFTAGVLVLGASLWGVYAAVRSPQKASTAAMASYADGRMAFDRGDYGLAVQDFTRTIEQQPNFASAYEWRAESYAGGVQTLFQVGPRDLARGIADATQARSLGSDDPLLLNDLSARLYVSGMRHRDRGQIAEAADLMANAHRLSPTNPAIAVNFAEDQVALGRPWKLAYAQAERLDAAVQDTSVRLSSLSSLTNVWDTPLGRSLRPSLAAAKEDLVASLSAGHGPAASSPPPPGLLAPGGTPSLSVSLHSRSGDLTLSPGQGEFFIDRGRGFDPVRDSLYAVWYRWSGGAWQSLPGLSGPVQKNTPTELNTSDSAPDQNRLFAIATRQAGSDCLASGEYKVELYVNGKFAGQATAEYAPTQLTSTPLADMSFSVCRPPHWTPAPAAQEGLIDGYVSPQKNAGMLVVDASSAAPTPTASAPVLQRVVQRLGGVLPARLTKPTAATGNEFAGGMCDGYVEEYQYPGGVLAAGIGRDNYGRELAGIVWGPSANFATTNALFGSMAADSPYPCQS
jgi:tetratricopeptide (TPR) repeat protein